MPGRWIRPACFALLVVVWLLDLVTPQLFVVAILANAPIALASLTRDTRFIRLFVALALVADVTAGYANGVQDGGHWLAIAIGDRLIVAASFLLVGGLSIAAQRSAARAGELAARQERLARERSVRRAVETVRASINPELIERAIVREAQAAFAVTTVRFYAMRPTRDELVCTSLDADAAQDVTTTTGRPDPSIVSFVQRVAAVSDGGEVAIGSWFVRDDDALSRLLLATLDATHAVAVPLVEHQTLFGVLLLARNAPFEPHFEEALDYFAAQAGIALAQAALFVQLADRNHELAELNGALQERSDVIRDIVYALSHDLRTPLVAARMTLQQALDGAYGNLPPAYRDILERSITSNEGLHRLAETLLLVSRYESGDSSTLREPVDLHATAQAAVAELEPLWRSKKLAVSLDASDGASSVAGDKSELYRAITNLLANAITWTPPGGAISVRFGEDSGVAQIAIEDTGYGVPAAERAHLFERVRETPGRQGAGSGLGLYLAHRIAQNHGGTITYAERATGGSTFTLTFPALRNLARV